MGTRKQMKCVLIFFEFLQKCAFHSSCLSSSAARLYFCVSRDLFGCILSTQSFPLPTESECLRQTTSSKADRPAQTAGSGWLSGGGGRGGCALLLWAKHYLIPHTCLMWNQGFWKTRSKTTICLTIISTELESDWTRKHASTRKQSLIRGAGSSAETCIPVICAQTWLQKIEELAKQTAVESQGAFWEKKENHMLECLKKKKINK